MGDAAPKRRYLLPTVFVFGAALAVQAQERPPQMDVERVISFLQASEGLPPKLLVRALQNCTENARSRALCAFADFAWVELRLDDAALRTGRVAPEDLAVWKAELQGRCQAAATRTNPEPTLDPAMLRECKAIGHERLRKALDDGASCPEGVPPLVLRGCAEGEAPVR